MKMVALFRISQFCIILASAFASGCAIKQSATHPHHPEFLAVVGDFSGSVDDKMELKSLMARSGLDGETRGPETYGTVLAPAAKAVLACEILSTNDLTRRGKVRLFTDSISPLEFDVSVGWFSGSVDDTKELYSLMKRNAIDGGLEGSMIYDVEVPASNAVLACEILCTNDLALRRKVHVYASRSETEKLIFETAADDNPSEIRKLVMPLFSRYHYSGYSGRYKLVIPENEIPKGVRALPVFSENGNSIETYWAAENSDGLTFLNYSVFGSSGIVVCQNENSRKFDAWPGYEYWGGGVYFYVEP